MLCAVSSQICLLMPPSRNLHWKYYPDPGLLPGCFLLSTFNQEQQPKNMCIHFVLLFNGIINAFSSKSKTHL